MLVQPRLCKRPHLNKGQKEKNPGLLEGVTSLAVLLVEAGLREEAQLLMEMSLVAEEEKQCHLYPTLPSSTLQKTHFIC